MFLCLSKFDDYTVYLNSSKMSLLVILQFLIGLILYLKNRSIFLLLGKKRVILNFLCKTLIVARFARSFSKPLKPLKMLKIEFFLNAMSGVWFSLGLGRK